MRITVLLAIWQDLTHLRFFGSSNDDSHQKERAQNLIFVPILPIKQIKTERVVTDQG